MVKTGKESNDDALRSFVKGFLGTEDFKLKICSTKMVMTVIENKCILIDPEVNEVMVYNLDEKTKLNMTVLSEQIWNSTMIDMYGEDGPKKV